MSAPGTMPRPASVATTEPGRAQYVPSGGIASGGRSMMGPPSSEPGVPLLDPLAPPLVGPPLLTLPDPLPLPLPEAPLSSDPRSSDESVHEAIATRAPTEVPKASQ
jgi:hypothetical protein